MSFTIQKSVYSILTLLLVGIVGYVPFYGMLALLFIPFPLMLIRMSGKRRDGMIYLFILSLLTIVITPLQLGMTSIAFMAMGYMIGETTLYRKSKLAVWNAASITLLVALVLQYVLSVLVLHVNAIEWVQAFLHTQERRIIQLFTPLDETGTMEQAIRSVFLMYNFSLPTYAIVGIVILAFLSLNIAYFFGKKAVLGFVFPRFQPFSSMKLPMITVVLYGILLLMSFLQSSELGSSSHLMILNAMNIFRILFLLQGISFIVYSLKKVQLPMILIVLSGMVAVFFNSITVIIGILDTGIQLRGWVDRKIGK